MCVQKGETAMNHTPVYTFGLGYPQDKNNIIHNSKLKDYEKSKSNCNN